MVKHRTCIRTDGLNRDQKKELKAKIDKVVSDYNQDIKDQSKEPEQEEE